MEGDSSTMRILDMNEEDTYDKEKIGILQKYSVYFQWCWWKRPPRVTALFLGSYVLLLAVIIGLSVHFNNRHYYAETMLQTSYKNLTKEKDQLKKNIEWLKSKIKVNLALNGVAVQSSPYGGVQASNAIDGERTSHYYSGSCTHTQEDTNPWWRVDLGDVYRVTTVMITNRKDCCAERLNGAELRIGNSLENNGTTNSRCAVISHIPAGETKAFQCKDMEGRYVVVVIPGRAEWLTLCEVEVYGSHAVSLALNGVAAQSSLYGNHKASDAIDGDRTSHYDSGSCTQTKKDTNPWWRVDLKGLYRVRTVSLTNRGDCCPERLDGAEIRIGNSLENNGINNPRCAVISHIPAGETKAFQCNEMEGRYVVVVIPGRAEWLTLCEVEVYGSHAVNLALNGVAAQSSLYGNHKASDAIDGDRTSHYDSGSCTHTQKDTNPWWRVDLGDVYRVRTVSLTNRGDCCPERLDGAEIRIGNSLENNGINNPRCAVISNIPAGETHYFQCNEMEGRYVVVVIPGRAEFLTLCEVEVYGSPAVNLALNGVAAQSSLYGNRNASDAIDGDRTSHYHSGSCTHTQKDTNPWWRVDLRDEYRVRSVSLTNRGDCCPERLDGAEIRIGNSLENNGINNTRCAVISNIPAGETHYFQCNEMEGRYVVVVIPGRAEFLTLCEVEIYGSPPVNLALKGKAAQSSSPFQNGRAFKAIDGDRDSHYDSGSCTQTKKDTNPWWRVDLKGLYRVRSVSLTNRGDCCPERLDGAEIRIGNSLENNGINNSRCAVISHIPAGETHYFQCNEMEGRYVVVVIPGREEFLTLCEVEVYGSPTVNLALNGVAAQSSLYGNRNASDAIDGDRTSHYGSCTHTQKDTNPWWRVDLRDEYRVRTVSLTNRGDCCPERLDGAEIRIGNSLENNGINNTRCAVISHIPAGETHYFQCNEMEGRYVVVVIPGRAEWLTLCEVEIYGSPKGKPML
uniref:Fucolectin tachylectin-4 pentraxin-1 domain-containing protein n=1 Tax=Esox lucius TaxID=8010 RepID=A0A3P9ADP9_ESOLU